VGKVPENQAHRGDNTNSMPSKDALPCDLIGGQSLATAVADLAATDLHENVRPVHRFSSPVAICRSIGPALTKVPEPASGSFKANRSGEVETRNASILIRIINRVVKNHHHDEPKTMCASGFILQVNPKSPISAFLAAKGPQLVEIRNHAS
jgi:hypothetical protein